MAKEAKEAKEQLKKKSAEELKIELAEKTKYLFDLRTKSVTEKLEDTSSLGKAKKDIARIKTILRQQELAAAKK